MAIPTSYSYVVVLSPVGGDANIMTVTRTARTTRHRIKLIFDDKHSGRPMFCVLTRTPRSPFTNFITQSSCRTDGTTTWETCRPAGEAVGIGPMLITDTACHPSSNGTAERSVQTLKQNLKKVCDGVHSSLNQRLSNFLILYQSMPHSTTNRSPVETKATVFIYVTTVGSKGRWHVEIQYQRTSSYHWGNRVKKSEFKTDIFLPVAACFSCAPHTQSQVKKSEFKTETYPRLAVPSSCALPPLSLSWREPLVRKARHGRRSSLLSHGTGSPCTATDPRLSQTWTWKGTSLSMRANIKR